MAMIPNNLGEASSSGCELAEGRSCLSFLMVCYVKNLGKFISERRDSISPDGLLIEIEAGGIFEIG